MSEGENDDESVMYGSRFLTGPTDIKFTAVDDAELTSDLDGVVVTMKESRSNMKPPTFPKKDPDPLLVETRPLLVSLERLQPVPVTSDFDQAKTFRYPPHKRLFLKDWILSKLNNWEHIDVLNWMNKEKGIFKLKWVHKATNTYDDHLDCTIFKEWAIASGKYDPADWNPTKWKANFRCALNSLTDIAMLPELSLKSGKDAYRCYAMLRHEVDGLTGSKMSRRKKKCRKGSKLWSTVRRPIKRIAPEVQASAATQTEISWSIVTSQTAAWEPLSIWVAPGVYDSHVQVGPACVNYNITVRRCRAAEQDTIVDRGMHDTPRDEAKRSQMKEANELKRKHDDWASDSETPIRKYLRQPIKPAAPTIKFSTTRSVSRKTSLLNGMDALCTAAAMMADTPEEAGTINEAESTPDGVPSEGLSSVTVGGLSSITGGGPSRITSGEPSSITGGEPLSITGGGPSNITSGGLSNVSDRGLSTRGSSTKRPSTRGPSTRGPSTRGPSTREPSTRGPLTGRPLTRGLPTRRPSTREPLTRGPPSGEPLTRGPSSGGPSSIVSDRPSCIGGGGPWSVASGRPSIIRGGGPLSKGLLNSGPSSGGPLSGEPSSGGPSSGGPLSGGLLSGEPSSGGPSSGGPLSGGLLSGDPSSEGPSSGGAQSDLSGMPSSMVTSSGHPSGSNSTASLNASNRGMLVTSTKSAALAENEGPQSEQPTTLQTETKLCLLKHPKVHIVVPEGPTDRRSTLFKDLISEQNFEHLGFTRCLGVNTVSHVRIYDSDTPSVEMCVRIHLATYKYYIHVHNQPLASNHEVVANLPPTIKSLAHLTRILTRLSGYVACIGNPEPMPHQHYSDYSMFCSAYQEPDMGAKNEILRYHSTIRSFNCRLLVRRVYVEAATEVIMSQLRCHECSRVRKHVVTLRGLLSLFEGHKVDRNSGEARERRMQLLAKHTTKEALVNRIETLEQQQYQLRELLFKDLGLSDAGENYPQHNQSENIADSLTFNENSSGEFSDQHSIPPAGEVVTSQSISEPLETNYDPVLSDSEPMLCAEHSYSAHLLADKQIDLLLSTAASSRKPS